ncbi:hypothetical protein Poli38472_006794 [Pythium oligandrum]|uniref:Uncharacterized protein n=1 Tax=Pythium oligandrum TaxID=41045 RepID=A0A8K1C582_PYTOL|nr:hypothetical protein Poli38472_006794 [Pythium oligandrum]|eukprot:TMW56784.1 hypothetical protein Poli38472_006794 [Pythium oligandrum]
MKLLRTFAPLGAAVFAVVSAFPVQEETKSLDELHAEALKEGGKVVIYHGGDYDAQQASTVNAFREAYPDINLTMVVDYSKYHDVRIDNQLATDSLVPDIVALQTLQDFTRWTKKDKLLKYKPAGFSEIYEPFKDESGAKTRAQKPEFNRGSHKAGEAVSEKRKTIGVAGSGPWTAKTLRGNGTDFLVWGQRIAILKKAKRPAAANFFLNWIISKDVQNTLFASWGVSPRKDVLPPSGQHLWEADGASTPLFPKFMEDRAKVEQLKATFALYSGEVRGEPSPGQLGLHPGA